jgi:hypothetical protein
MRHDRPRCHLAGMVGLALLASSPAVAAADRTVHIAPADDHVLGALLLTGRGGAEPVLLFDPYSRSAVDHFLSTWRGNTRCYYRTEEAQPVAVLMRELAGEPCTVVDDLTGFARTLWPEAKRAIATPVDDYEWLLRAAAFAGATGSVLLPVADGTAPSAEALDGWQLEVLYATRPVAGWAKAAAPVVNTIVKLRSPDSLSTTLLPLLPDPPTAVVVTNPADRDGLFSPSTLSLLAPLVASVHHAPLVVASGAEPETVEQEVLAFLDSYQLAPTHAILVGDELALRSHRVPDPVLAGGGRQAWGGDTMIRVELFSEIQHERPQDLVVGRIVAEGVAEGSATLARQYHRPDNRRRRPVIFFANADGVFRLGETISRTTVAEFENVRVPVRAYYGDDVTQRLIHKSLGATDILVWEGHARDLTLEEQGGIAAAEAPEIVVLQGCYTFDRSDPFILMEKGTIAILGTSTAVYSASGAALARMFFDAILYGGQDLGTATRDARNYLLALAQLQHIRQHKDWRKTYRAALAFAFWGDPTVMARLRPERPKVAPVRWAFGDARLSLEIPRGRLPHTGVGPYYVKAPPRAGFGGLLLRQDSSERRQLKDLYFTVQHLDAGPQTVCTAGKGWNVISLYAPRTRTITVLARPDWKLIGRPPSEAPFVFSLAAERAACPPGPGSGV